MNDLATVRDHIAASAKLARRPLAEITLIAVSKTRSVVQIESLIAAGQRDFGENRVQEAAEKWPALRAAYPDVRLHMIGQLQSNKATDAVALFDMIHSLDRRSLLDALSVAATKAGRFPACFVQVNVGQEEQKGGVAPADLGDFITAVRASPLPFAGLMCIPPAELEPAPFFAFLSELARRHDVVGSSGGLSMGMSADYEIAVKLGATHVRVGSALFS
ncbi:YggS family pyridoxal phosphate-dependent enzyme [Sphingomonas sp.]|uniref:YggS family pyridoxal phosphate-dependent enzyme n=1 Tax=Sphingomonas sp. TaxID=28214 RepID=UPI00286AA251|nr:YggS family pyridoxal phosphate-dependent enzyme [Sphingomonas sp.]